jgi:hypothetical protein
MASRDRSSRSHALRVSPKSSAIILPIISTLGCTQQLIYRDKGVPTFDHTCKIWQRECAGDFHLMQIKSVDDRTTQEPSHWVWPWASLIHLQSSRTFFLRSCTSVRSVSYACIPPAEDSKYLRIFAIDLPVHMALQPRPPRGTRFQVNVSKDDCHSITS